MADRAIDRVFEGAWCVVILGAFGAASVVVATAALLRALEASVRRCEIPEKIRG